MFKFFKSKAQIEHDQTMQELNHKLQWCNTSQACNLIYNKLHSDGFPDVVICQALNDIINLDRKAAFLAVGHDQQIRLKNGKFELVTTNIK